MSPAKDPGVPDEYKPSSLPFSVPRQRLDCISSLQYLQTEIYEISKTKGFWDEHEQLRNLIERYSQEAGVKNLKDPNLADLLYKMSRTMLVVTELSEGIEALRLGDPPDDKVPEFSGFTVELADAFIRILDIATRFDLPIAEAVLKKIEFNKTRTHKHGGKSI